MKRNLKLFCSAKITQIHATITLEDAIIKMVVEHSLFVPVVCSLLQHQVTKHDEYDFD
jgi:hypothetical protein